MSEKNKKVKLEKDYYTIGELAKLLNVHIDTIRRWDKKGKLKPIRVGELSWRRYRKVDIEKILNAR